MLSCLRATECGGMPRTPPSLSLCHSSIFRLALKTKVFIVAVSFGLLRAFSCCTDAHFQNAFIHTQGDLNARH